MAGYVIAWQIFCSIALYRISYIEIVRREIAESKTETIKWIAAIVLGTGVAQIFAIIGVLTHIEQGK